MRKGMDQAQGKGGQGRGEGGDHRTRRNRTDAPAMRKIAARSAAETKRRTTARTYDPKRQAGPRPYNK